MFASANSGCDPLCASDLQPDHQHAADAVKRVHAVSEQHSAVAVALPPLGMHAQGDPPAERGAVTAMVSDCLETAYSHQHRHMGPG